MDNRGLMDESEHDRQGDAGQADPVPAGQLDLGRILHARDLARAELAIAVLLILGVLWLLITAPGPFTSPFMGYRHADALRLAGDALTLAGFAGLFGGLTWMIRIYRRGFGHGDDPSPWRSRRPR
jgi:Na+-driven multidrug efflux pump